MRQSGLAAVLFNSGIFFGTFALVYALYWILPFRAQNLMLLVASYVFYGYWDYRFLSLLAISTLIDYAAGLGIEAARRHNRPQIATAWLWFSVAGNMGILAFFKYFNFFVGSFAALLQQFGLTASPITLRIILPVGISFYSFQTLSYTIDVYRGHLKPTRRLDDFALFVSFFPQLVAGPIERATRLLPQVQRERHVTYDDLSLGGWLILWGLFKKVYIADNLAPYAAWAFARHGATTGADVYLAVLSFSIQIYCDFSGYSDIACGLGRLLGFDLTRNFYLPYFASNPAELWRRWHITLASWFRDYVYTPLINVLAGSRRDLAAFLTMALVGLWHGANWTYVAWGAGWGAVLVAYRRLRPWLASIPSDRPAFAAATTVLGVLVTFNIWLLLAAFFISDNITSALHSERLLLTDFRASSTTARDALTILYYSYPLLIMQALQRWADRLDIVRVWPAPVRFALYTSLITLMLVAGAEHDLDFIYFAF